MAQYLPAEYYDVEAENGRIILTPVQVTRMDVVWNKMEALGITEDDIADAVKWSRSAEGAQAAQPA